MRAARYERLGPAAEVLRVEEIADPEPGPGEVRVRIRFSGVNPTDWKGRAGLTPRPIDGFQVPHQDGAGVIDAVGEGVDAARVGERVWIWLAAAAGRRWGTAAELSVVPAPQAVPMPAGESMELGASLGVPALTARHCLFRDGPVEGRTVLVAGGAGAVGHFAIELAKWGGAQVVSTVSGEEKARLALAAGADLVVNYREPDAAERIRSLAGPVDRIVELALGANAELDLAVSRPGTAIVTYASEATDPVLPVRKLMNANVQLEFVMLYGVGAEALQAAVQDVSAALAAGALSELPLHRFPLEEIAAAQEAVEQGAVGKVIVEP